MTVVDTRFTVTNTAAAIMLTLTESAKFAITKEDFLPPQRNMRQITHINVRTAWRTKQAGIAANVKQSLGLEIGRAAAILNARMRSVLIVKPGSIEVFTEMHTILE